MIPTGEACKNTLRAEISRLDLKMTQTPVKIKRAIISCWRKEPTIEFGKTLSKLGVKIFSSGGTAKALSAEGIEVVPLEEITGFSELLGGRVKTLHPNVHASILARLDSADDKRDLDSINVDYIDLVAVDLYPFPENVDDGELPVELIDIGGVALIRGAAKNFQRVAVIPSADHFKNVGDELIKNGGTLSLEYRYQLAQSAFDLTANYDRRISDAFSSLAK
jgi:phosphoribosylaminoimidazolecarboxamide formyltransferase/IMP cyclohydrolase